MNGDVTIERATNGEPFDPAAAFLELKFRKKGFLVEFKKSESGVPVYFIHELIGNVSCYHRIAKATDGPVFGIQVPQLERNVSLVPTIETLAARYVELIVKNSPEGPIRLVGWSAGSTIALEVARQLTDCGRQPQLLVNIDQPIDNAKGIVSPYRSFPENLYYWLANEPKWPPSRFAARLTEKVRESIMTLAGRPPAPPVHDPSNAVAKAMTPEEVAFIERLYDLLFAYIPPRSYAGRVLSFVATENPQPERLIRSWKSVARNSEFIWVAGDHDTLVMGPGAIEVRDHINKAFSELAA